MTYTYSLLPISREAYEEIRAKLEEAGYQHAIDGDIIDMHGIGIGIDSDDKNDEAQEIEPHIGRSCARSLRRRLYGVVDDESIAKVKELG